MRASLLKWIGDADALRYMDRFGILELPLDFEYQHDRTDDLYIALVGELFDRMREEHGQHADWARLGNALAQYAKGDRAKELHTVGISQSEAALFSAAAFYCGGFPASACLTMRDHGDGWSDDAGKACFVLLAKDMDVSSTIARDLLGALSRGDLDAIAGIEARVAGLASAALHTGPSEWIPLRLLQSIVARFRSTNLRAVLPQGTRDFWTPLVTSLRNHGIWEFFPSQIEAIRGGLLTRPDTFSLQMPTGAGKTALCEALLFSHLAADQLAAAVLLVPYRSLASELRHSLVRRLNRMGIPARCAYGGTVPSGSEVRAFDATRALVATPEALSGILTANAAFADRLSLVICDEGHLLDAPSRGIGLELLLTRMKARDSRGQRFVFMSAIVPNIEEINLWLGGADDSVVRSDYRPAIAEFSVLRSDSADSPPSLYLEMHPHEVEPIRYRIGGFLRRENFRWRNPATQLMNTYKWSVLKTRAVAAARKALPMGAAVVFAANKRGNQGAIGLAEELLSQMKKGLGLPDPLSFAERDTIAPVIEYLQDEYGDEWVGTRALAVGAVLHHGDIPQETREVLETLLRKGRVALAICTNTLAEGVNLPIRTLVLYSVERLGQGGARENLLTRDIKNLVGRAGRAGATTKGLVICINERQWPLVRAVARQASGESVGGALRSLLQQVSQRLAAQDVSLTDELLEGSPRYHALVDGVDATLIDLAASEIGEEELLRLAADLADQTFAYQQTDEASRQLLRAVFTLRAQRVVRLRTAGQLGWIRATGARTRLVDLVESGLLPMRTRWDDVVDPVSPELVAPVLHWAWTQPEVQQAVRRAYRLGTGESTDAVRDSFAVAVRLWLSGESFIRIAEGAGVSIDAWLGVHSDVLTYALQTIVEQAVALLEEILQARGQGASPAVLQFPEHLRFGVPTEAGRMLAAGGLRHRRAFVAIGSDPRLREVWEDNRLDLFIGAQELIEQDREGWRDRLGKLVFDNTIDNLSAVTGQIT